MIVQDLSRIPERAKRELIRGEHARAEFAIHAQRRLAQAMGEMGPTRHIEGIGRKVATIHPELAARIRVKFGVRCLHDPEFLRKLIHENPFLKAPCVPRALTLRVDGLKDSRRSEDAASTAATTEFQDGDGNGSAGDPRAASACSTRRGSTLLVSPERGSAHETPARSDSEAVDRKSEAGRV